MTMPLRVPIVEDSEDDTQVLLRGPQRAGFAAEHARVDSSAAGLHGCIG
jgi:hypothetical protein